MKRTVSEARRCMQKGSVFKVKTGNEWSVKARQRAQSRKERRSSESDDKGEEELKKRATSQG